MAAGYKFGTLIKYHASLEIQLEPIRVQVCADDCVLKFFCIVSKFKTEDIRTWAALRT